MTVSKDVDHIVAIIGKNHQPLATTATRQYRARGRGVIVVEFPRRPLHRAPVRATYATAEDLRRAAPGDAMESLIAVVETYHPDHEAVVLACLRGGAPITIIMKLHPPTLLEAPPGVH